MLIRFYRIKVFDWNDMGLEMFVDHKISSYDTIYLTNFGQFERLRCENQIQKRNLYNHECSGLSESLRIQKLGPRL